MDRQEILRTGRTLGADLEAAASDHHVRSDSHNVMLVESAVVLAYIDNLHSGAPILDNLKRSWLLDPSSRFERSAHPELTERTAAFFRAVLALRESS